MGVDFSSLPVYTYTDQNIILKSISMIKILRI